MDCIKVTEKLSAYIDGVVDEQTLEAIEAHLAGCESCRRELAALQAIVCAVGQADDATPPPHLRERILTAARDSRELVERCTRISEMLSAYVDDELPTRDRALVADHLLACEECASEAKMLKTLVGAAAEIDPVAPPADLRARIAAAVDAVPEPRVRVTMRLSGLVPTRTLRWVSAAVAAGVITLAVVVSMPGTQTGLTARQAPRERTAVTAKARPAAPSQQIGVQTAELKPSTPEPTRLRDRRHETRRRVMVASLPSPAKPPVRALPKPVMKQVVEPVEEPETASAVDDPAAAETSKMAEVAVSAPTAVEPAIEVRKEPEAVKVAAANLSEDAKAWMKQMKTEAAMRRDGSRSGGFQIITSRF